MLRMIVGHAKNPAICGGYWDDPTDPARERKIPVDDLGDASRKFREFIERNRLGMGNLTRRSGWVLEGGAMVARVSYNGAVWSPEGNWIEV